MSETYSLAIKGQRADSLPSPIKNVVIGDSAARAGGQALAMMNGTQILCQNPDGSQSWYTLDAERSTSQYPVLRPV